jgi:glycosyltransferase involved in cell wall biosynthesis
MRIASTPMGELRKTMSRRVVFDVTGLVHWYAYKRDPSGIQKVMENVLSRPLLAARPDSIFIFRPIGSENFYIVNPSYIMGLSSPGLRRFSIACLRRVFAESMKIGVPSRVWNEMLSDHLTYMAIGWGGVARYWEALNLGRWPKKGKGLQELRGLTSCDLIVILGDFWCHRDQAYALLRLKARSSARLMLMIHDIFPINHPEWTHPHYGKEFCTQLETLSPHVDHWLTNSQYVRQQLRDELLRRGIDAPKIDVLPMGGPTPLPLPVWTDSDANILRGKGLTKGTYFLCVGTVEPRKNLNNLIEAVVQLGDTITSKRMVCVVVGHPGWRSKNIVARLRSLEERGGCIRWIEAASDRELTALYRGARFSVVPSHDEGWGLVVQESIRHGLPCIAVAVGGLREAGRDLATFVSAASTEDLRNAIARYLTDGAALSRARRRIRRRLLDGAPPPSWRDAAAFLLGLARHADPTGASRHLLSSRDAGSRSHNAHQSLFTSLHTDSGRADAGSVLE